MNVVIIKYNAGNIMSVKYALERLGIQAIVTADSDMIKKADKVIFPGVGEASTTMTYLKEHKLDELIKNLRQPVLGICLGLQLMCSYSEEGDTECLGIFDERVSKFSPLKGEINYKIPHMGWNSISNLKGPLFDKSFENEYFYFVHSYYAGIGPSTSAVTEYCNSFSAGLEKDNFYATQFHPEKSGPLGALLLKKFIDL
jgi:imidazole glycerol-phosphate synthase subunit HisH